MQTETKTPEALAAPANYRGRVLHLIRHREFYSADQRKISSFVPKSVTEGQYRNVLSTYRGASFAADRCEAIRTIFS